MPEEGTLYTTLELAVRVAPKVLLALCCFRDQGSCYQETSNRG